MNTVFRAVCLLMLVLLLQLGTAFAQSTVLKLHTADTSSSFTITKNDNTKMFRVFGDGGLYGGGAYGVGAIPFQGAGARLMWYPRKAAFRAGFVSGTQWDDGNVGVYSIALGYQTTAGGYISTALGNQTIANGYIATAMGNSTTASGFYATAMGQSTTASGEASTAMGYGTTASGQYSTALGTGTTASGGVSTAIGAYVSTDSKYGACIIGDMSTTTPTNSSAANEMTMRFAGGYRLYSTSGLTFGVYMNSGVSGWSNYCDRNKKENFRQIDGEQLLSKIRTMPITEWNYIGTNGSVRYIGPVAQDFYSAFHLGGNDSLGINSICIDGVNMAAIQALEKRTKELQVKQTEMTEATMKISKLEQIVSQQQSELTVRNKKVDELQKEFIRLQKEITAVLKLPTSQKDGSLTSTVTDK